MVHRRGVPNGIRRGSCPIDCSCQRSSWRCRDLSYREASGHLEERRVGRGDGRIGETWPAGEVSWALMSTGHLIGGPACWRVWA